MPFLKLIHDVWNVFRTKSLNLVIIAYFSTQNNESKKGLKIFFTLLCPISKDVYTWFWISSWQKPETENEQLRDEPIRAANPIICYVYIWACVYLHVLTTCHIGIFSIASEGIIEKSWIQFWASLSVFKFCFKMHFWNSPVFLSVNFTAEEKMVLSLNVNFLTSNLFQIDLR